VAGGVSTAALLPARHSAGFSTHSNPRTTLIEPFNATSGRQDQDWTADYKLFNRSPWQADTLFSPVVERCVSHCKEQSYLVLAGDFTHLAKSGKHIANVSCIRDPMSPPLPR